MTINAAISSTTQSIAEGELRALVSLPVPYRLGLPGDPPDRVDRLRALDVELLRDGVDCLEILIVAFARVGQLVGDPEAWQFPIPAGYPYQGPQESGAWMPHGDFEAFARLWIPVRWPGFGDIVAFGEDHVGMLLGRAGALEVLHCHRSHGTAIHPLNRLRRWVTGTHRLRALAA